MGEPYKEFDQTKIVDTTDVVIKGFRVRVRELALIGVGLVCLLVIIILAALLATAKNTSTAESGAMSSSQTSTCNDMCTTPSCLKAAGHVTELIDPSKAKPCDNFHAFACGNFRALHPLDPENGVLTTSWLIYNKNMDKLRRLLEKKISISPFDATHWDTKLKTFFASCNDHFHSMQRQGTPLLEKMLKPSGGWWALMGDTDWASHQYSFQFQLEKVHVDFWTDAFFTFSITTDWLDWNKATIAIDLSGTALPSFYYTDDAFATVQEDYKKFIRTVGGLLLRDAGLNLTESEHKYRLQTFVDDAYTVEKELSKLKENSMATLNPHSDDKRMTLQQLDDVAGGALSFVQLFAYMFNSANVNALTKVVVYEQDYVAKFTAWIRDLNPANKTRILNNYMVWRMAHSYAQDLSWDYIHANRQVYVDLTGRIEFLGTWRYCVAKVKSDMHEALSALFVQSHFVDANKKEAHTVTKYIMEAMETALKDKMHWMSQKTRGLAMEKVRKSLVKLGYPEYLMKNDTLNNIYSGLTVTVDDYFGNLLSMNKFYKSEWNRRLKNQGDRSVWEYATYDFTAEYYNPWRELIIPAGVLQFPIFDHKSPRYMNFGALGTIVGSNLVHAIDEIGNKFMLNGSHYGSWWSENTTKTYGGVKQCFKDAVRNLTLNPIQLPRPAQPIPVPPINETYYAPIALGESSGIRLAYNAYQQWIREKGQEKKIPGGMYTNNQLFFISYAQTFCFNRNPFETMRRAASQRILEEDIRVNAALAQLKEFQETFNCPDKSHMVAPKRCNLY